MLYVYAEADEIVPTADSVAYLRALPTTEGRNIEIRVLPGLDHTMFSVGGVVSGSITDAAFLDMIGRWAAAEVKAARPPDDYYGLPTAEPAWAS